MMMTEKTNQTVDRVLLIGVMLIASWLRLHYLFQVEHSLDHAYPVWQALRTLSYGEFPLVFGESGDDDGEWNVVCKISNHPVGILKRHA